MLVVAAECRILPDHWQEFEEEMARITDLVRAEPGCTRYDTTTSVEEPGLFLILEEWESRAHLEAHLETDHMKEHKTLSSGWIAEPTRLSLYETLSVQRLEL